MRMLMWCRSGLCVSRAVFAPAQVINFALVPPQFRFVFVGVVSLFWSACPLPPSPSHLYISLFCSFCAKTSMLIAVPCRAAPCRADTYLSAVNAQQKEPSEVDVKDIGLTLA